MSWSEFSDCIKGIEWVLIMKLPETTLTLMRCTECEDLASYCHSSALETILYCKTSWCKYFKPPASETFWCNIISEEDIDTQSATIFAIFPYHMHWNCMKAFEPGYSLFTSKTLNGFCNTLFSATAICTIHSCSIIFTATRSHGDPWTFSRRGWS